MAVDEETREQERLANLTADEAERELTEVIVPAIDAAKANVETLYERRRILFRVLLAGGRKQAAVARLAGVTPMAVSFAVDKASSGKQNGGA